MTVSDALDELWEKINDCNLDTEGMDDEDLIVKALCYLRNNAEDVFCKCEPEEE